MASKYPHLLSPVKVGNLVLKDRMISSNALPHFLQGPETFPAEPVINHMVRIAKNGAAVVTFADWTNMAQRTSPNEDGKRFPMFTLDSDPSVENYICQLADQVHYYGSYISLALMPFYYPKDPTYDVSDEPAVSKEALDSFFFAKFGEHVYDNYGMQVMVRRGEAGKQMTKEMIKDLIEIEAQRAKKYQAFGFDMVTLHFAYRATLFSRFISPRTNHRTDEYGGPIENRARFMLELCARIKELCGKNFPIEVQITAREDDGMTIEDSIKLSKMAEGLVDIFQFRAQTANLNHPTGYNSTADDYVALSDCAAVKAGGTKILCGPIGGFQDPDDMERVLAEGKADLIEGARMFFCDFDFYEKLKENRGEDIVPCIRCNKCHVPSLTGEWLSYCSVNPCMGIDHRLDKLTKPVTKKRNVAIVGGGPAGMRAALFARERGYSATLFEASAHLGGQLNLFDVTTFKWPLVRYRKWLISQLDKQGVCVRLNTPVTRELLVGGGYDAVIFATGAKPLAPPIPGVDKAYSIFEVFGSENKMAKKCVVIGGSESGTEAGLYLAENGHDVTILTRGDTLCPDATPIHYRETIDEYFQTMDNISYITGAVTTSIGDGYVEYKKDGETHRIECGDVVALGGMKSNLDTALDLYDVCPNTYLIGDCKKVGNLHTGVRAAYSAIYNL